MLRDLLNAILKETETLGDLKIQTDQFLANLNDAMTVNVESLTHRDTRRDGDYVLDDVQGHLRKVLTSLWDFQIINTILIFQIIRTATAHRPNLCPFHS